MKRQYFIIDNISHLCYYLQVRNPYCLEEALVSNEKHTQATLDGFEGPFFPSSIDELRKQLDIVGLPNGSWLEDSARNIEGFVDHLVRPTTSDGYTWFWSLEFFEGSGKVAILIPWSQDWDKSDDTQSDRAIAVYAHGVDEVTVELVVQQFTLAVERRAHRMLADRQ